MERSGRPAVAIDPVVKEPAEVLVGELFERALEADGIAVEGGVEAVGFGASA